MVRDTNHKRVRAYVNPEHWRYAPKSVIACKESTITHPLVNGYSHWITVGARERDHHFSIYYPDEMVDGFAIVKILDCRGTFYDAVLWLDGSYGLFNELLAEYGGRGALKADKEINECNVIDARLAEIDS